MEIRFAKNEEAVISRELWEYCFNDSFTWTSWFFSQPYKPENNLLAFLDGKIIGTLQTEPHNIVLRGQQIAAAYMFGLATLPGYRGSGAGVALLKEAYLQNKNRGQGVAIMSPFDPDYYYPKGWSWCYYRHFYKQTLASLAPYATKSQGEWEILANPFLAIEVLQHIYKTWLWDCNGYSLRINEQWQTILADHAIEEDKLALLREDGQPSAYIFYNIKNECFNIKEMAWLDPKAAKKCLYFIYQHGSQAKFWTWAAPTMPEIVLLLPGLKKGPELKPFRMGRITDFQTALELAAYPEDGSLDLEIVDNMAEWNNGLWHLQVTNGKCTVSRSKKSQAKITIGAFTQLYFGTFGGKDLAKADILTGEDTAIETLNRLFPSQVNYINEIF